MQLIGSDVANIKEFDDDGEFLRSYTNKEMQDILVDYFGLTTSTIGEVLLLLQPTLKVPVLWCPILLLQR